MYLDIIIIAFVAVFILLRLRAELGKKTGNEPLPPVVNRSPYAHSQSDSASRETVVVDLKEDSAVRQTYQSILRYNRSFDPASFKEGSMNAYGMTLEAFWSGDRDTLKTLLDETVYEQFSAAIDQREADGLVLENRLLDITDAKVIAGHMEGSVAELTVEFTAEVIALTRDKDKNIVEGDPTDASELNDKWTFARDVRGEDPVWKLIATRAG